MIFGKRRREEAARRRDALRRGADELGWTWTDAQPPAPFETAEAILRGHREFRVWPVGLTEVIDGVIDGHAFRASRVVGYDYSTTNGGIPYGDRRETCAVWMELRAPLPELRLVDTKTSAKDLGLALPVLNPPRTADGRWQVEGFVPAFAFDLLHHRFVTALSAFPLVTAIVVRAGRILAYGVEPSDLPTIRAVARSLATLVENIPERAWGRTDALIAGTGVFPSRVRSGAETTLDRRLIRPDWKGYGLGEKVPWQTVPDAPRHVIMKRSEAIDRWDESPAEHSGFFISASFGNWVIGPENPHGISTVASTLVPGTPPRPRS